MRFVYCFLYHMSHGIQEVSGSIPLISTIEALKTNGFQGFFLFMRNFSRMLRYFSTMI